MRKLLLVSLALLSGLGIISTKLWLDLSAERQTNAELQTQLTEARIVPRTPAATMQVAASPASAPASAAAAREACVAAAMPALPPVDSDLLVRRAVDAAITARVFAASGGPNEQELMKDPDYRRAHLTVERLKLAQMNPGLAEVLGVSEKEANRYFEVMAEQQMKLTTELSAANSSGGMNAKTLEAVTQRMRAAGDPARAAMGDVKYAQYQEYQQYVRPALAQVSSMGSVLTAAGQPLNESQARGLTSAMLAEQQRLRQEEALARTNPNPGGPRAIADTLEESNKRLDESNRRILEASPAYLNAAQQEALKARFDQQSAQRRSALESAREMDARRQSQPPTAPASTF
jgi:hypothetical protein